MLAISTFLLSSPQKAHAFDRILPIEHFPQGAYVVRHDLVVFRVLLQVKIKPVDEQSAMASQHRIQLALASLQYLDVAAGALCGIDWETDTAQRDLFFVGYGLHLFSSHGLVNGPPRYRYYEYPSPKAAGTQMLVLCGVLELPI